MLLIMIGMESSNNPNALSSKGAGGLMQLMPGTAHDLGVTNVYNPTQNITGGAHYMSNLLKHYSGDTNKALAAYNAGEHRIDKGGILPNETQNYLNKYNKFNGA